MNKIGLLLTVAISVILAVVFLPLISDNITNIEYPNKTETFTATEDDATAETVTLEETPSTIFTVTINDTEAVVTTDYTVSDDTLSFTVDSTVADDVIVVNYEYLDSSVSTEVTFLELLPFFFTAMVVTYVVYQVKFKN